MPKAVPIRNIGAAGVITDLAPYNTPLTAFTRAKNVRFVSGTVERAPIFREVRQYTYNPAFAYALSSQTGYDSTLVVTNLFRVLELVGETSSEVYNGAAVSENALPYTATTLANVHYVNRTDTTPVYRTPSMTNFSVLSNFPASTTCRSLRSYGDFLLALNTSEGASEYPTRVRWSDLALANNIPSSWDATDTTKSAGFNDLVQLKTPIVDGLPLGSNFFIYSSDQVYLMEYVGGQFIFNFRKAIGNRGIINTNCAVEIDGKHYVFDKNDIYVHDGISAMSICDKRTKSYIFDAIGLSKAASCYVQHNETLKEVYFCYNSSDDLVKFEGVDYCNRAAVYNYKDDTWSFLDLPNTVSGTYTSVAAVETYDTVTLTYETVGGSYAQQDSQFTRYPVMLSRASAVGDNTISANRLIASDFINTGTLTKAYVEEINGPAYIKRQSFDLDEMQFPISGYKSITRIYPQISSPTNDMEASFAFGGSKLTTEVPALETPVTFAVDSDYKVDTRISGRYLTYEVTLPQPKDFTFSGFDFDVSVVGRR